MLSIIDFLESFYQFGRDGKMILLHKLEDKSYYWVDNILYEIKLSSNIKKKVRHGKINTSSWVIVIDSINKLWGKTREDDIGGLF